jgi:hypothetical protein
MTMEPAYWDSVWECRELIDKLALRAEQWIKREPEIDGLLELQNRAGAWLRRLHPERPGIERRAARARLLYDRRCSRFTKVWQEKGSFAQEAQERFGELSTVLIRDEVERRKAQVNWADSASILNALHGVAQRLEEFWQCRPGQDPPPAAGTVGGIRPRDVSTPEIKKRGSSRKQGEDCLSEVSVLVRRMNAEGCTHLQMCAQLGIMPRPPMARWKNLPWPVAFKDPKYHDAVKTKLSKMIHAVIS